MSRLLSFLFIFSLTFTAVNAQSVYTIKVNDLLGAVDSAAVTFGDSTKYTDSSGVAIFYNPLVGVNDNPTLPTSFAVSNAYPNPVKGDEIRLGVSSAKETEMEFKIYDIAGKLVSKGKTYLNAGAYSLNVKGVKNLAGGVYFIKVTDGKESCVRKFVTVGNGANGSLSFSVSAGNAGFIPPNAPTDAYISLHIEKNGYIDYDEQVNPAQTTLNVALEREGRTISGSVFDNVKYAFGNREPLEAKVKIFYNGNVKEQTGKVFDFQAPRSLYYLDSIKCVGVGEDTSFVLTYIDFPVDSDRVRLDFLVTTFNDLIYGYNVPDDSAVTIEQFELMAREGIFAFGNADVAGAKGVNVDNINNPIYENPDPTTDHGYEIVIPTHQISDLDPNSGPWTPEQQQQLKEIIENDIETKYPIGKRMRVRLLTDNDTLPVFHLISPPDTLIRPYPGVSIVSRGTGGFTYSFSAFDYNSDGWTDGAYIKVGTDFAEDLPGTRQELHSIHITMPLEPTDIPGDVDQRSIFLQSGHKSYDFTTTVDNKLVNGILMNMSENLMTSYDNNGEERIRVNYIPKKPQREILGN